MPTLRFGPPPQVKFEIEPSREQIDFFREQGFLTIDRLTSDGLAVSIIAVAEVYEGAFATPAPEETLANFREFLRGYSHLPVSDAIAARFARLRAALRRQGQLIPDMDLLIAATALEENLTLLTRNVRHFARVP